MKKMKLRPQSTTSYLIIVLFLQISLDSTGVKCRKEEVEYRGMRCRKHSAVLTEYGGVGDGITSNTKAFQYAIGNLSHHANDGGSLLIVPPGTWLTGSFNLTSHFTLFLHQDATILASQDITRKLGIHLLATKNGSRLPYMPIANLVPRTTSARALTLSPLTRHLRR